MARKPKAPLETGSPLLLAEEPDSIAVGAEDSRPNVKPAPARIIQPTSPPAMAVVDPYERIEISIVVAASSWTATGFHVGDGGELLDDFTLQGIEPSEVQHAAYAAAATVAMRQIEIWSTGCENVIWLPEAAPVGFLRVTVPDRIQRESWDEELLSIPYPEVYRTFAELYGRLKPRIAVHAPSETSRETAAA